MLHSDSRTVAVPPRSRRLPLECTHCGAPLSAVTWTCARGLHCPGAGALPDEPRVLPLRCERAP